MFHAHVSSGAGTVDPVVAAVSNGLSLTPTPRIPSFVTFWGTSLLYIREGHSADVPQLALTAIFVGCFATVSIVKSSVPQPFL
jgi:hypothetical protein